MNYFILGLGLTGISAIKTLSKMDNIVFGYDENLKDLANVKKDLENYKYELIDNIDEFNLSQIDIVVKSPGIKLNNKIIRKFMDLNIEVVSDLELAYRLFPDKNLVSITGTNGKTTTTMLLTHIINTSNKKAIAVGNIGVGMLWEIYSNQDVDFFIIESSSFQLASASTFRTKVSGIINISTDHLDWHGSFEEYVLAKANIYKNQTKNDCLVINNDDEKILEITKCSNSKIFRTSIKTELKEGVFIKEEKVFYKKDDKEKQLFDIKELKIVGLHNVQNTLIAVGMSIKLGIDIDCIIKGCKTFLSVEHRIEFVKEISGVKYYNDSKGTNIDATLKAVNSFKNPIILIAGGYDKKVKFDDLFDNFPSNIKKIILFGETKKTMEKTAKKYGFKNVQIVFDMKEAVEISKNCSKDNDVVLLSPANASWGIYKSYIERGNHFKKLVNEIR